MSIVPLIKKFRLASTLNQPEVQQYISGLTTPLSSAQKTKLNTFVRALKSGLGISSLSSAFDVMYILAGETAESSLRNLVKNAHHCTAVNSPTFAALEGFTSNGTSSYINTTYRPNTHKATMSLYNIAFGCYFKKNNYGAFIETGTRTDTNNGITINGYNAAGHGFQGRINSALCPSIVGPSNNGGLYVLSKYISGSDFSGFVNGTKIADTTAAQSLEITDYQLFICAGNFAGTPSLYSPNQLRFVFLGRFLTEAENLVVFNAVESYMDANGKGLV